MKTPASAPLVQRQIRALAESVVGERVDAVLLVPVLMRSLAVEVNDFVRYWLTCGDADARMKDHAILLASPIAKRTKQNKKDSETRVDDTQYAAPLATASKD